MSSMCMHVLNASTIGYLVAVEWDNVTRRYQVRHTDAHKWTNVIVTFITDNQFT